MAMDWHDIGTVPMDGTRIWLRDDDNHKGIILRTKFDVEQNDWVDTIRGIPIDGDFIPTHWAE